MTKAFTNISHLIMLFALLSGSASGLEPLSRQTMKDSVAQAGIDIAINHLVTEVFSEHLTITNPDDEAQFLRLNNIHILTETFAGVSDANGNSWITPLRFDVGLYGDLAMIHIQCLDLSMRSTISIESIDFCGTNLGSAQLDNLFITAFDFWMGPHAGGSGIEYELSQRISFDSFTYQYNSTESLTVSGMALAGSFGGTLEDPGTWVPEGSFRIGNLSGANPAALDISGDPVEYWTFTDSHGVDYTVNNPRHDTGFVALNMPLSGSLRIENVGFGGATQTDVGMIAIDGMNVEKLYIEIPGRGLGKP